MKLTVPSISIIMNRGKSLSLRSEIETNSRNKLKWIFLKIIFFNGSSVRKSSSFSRIVQSPAEHCKLWRRRAAVYCSVLQPVAHPPYAVCTDLTPRRAVGGQATVSFFAAATLGSHNVVRTQTTRTGCVRPDQSKSRPVVGGSCQSVESWNFILELLTLYLPQLRHSCSITWRLRDWEPHEPSR